MLDGVSEQRVSQADQHCKYGHMPGVVNAANEQAQAWLSRDT
jgi:hypothetical protein